MNLNNPILVAFLQWDTFSRPCAIIITMKVDDFIEIGLKLILIENYIHFSSIEGLTEELVNIFLIKFMLDNS